MRPASLSAASIKPSAGARWLTRPSAWARSALIGSPVAIISSAMRCGTARGRRNRPPAMAASARLTSGRPKLAPGTATIRSQARASSQPPARAGPLTAAIQGFWRSAKTKPPKPPRSLHSSWPRPADRSFRSAPALKARLPAPVSTTAQMSASASVAATMASSARVTAPLMALRAAGRLSVTRATWSGRRSNSTAASGESVMVLAGG